MTKKECNKCGALVTHIQKGYNQWYPDPMYTRHWLCHDCYRWEDLVYYKMLRHYLKRIHRPRNRKDTEK